MREISASLRRQNGQDAASGGATASSHWPEETCGTPRMRWRGMRKTSRKEHDGAQEGFQKAGSIPGLHQVYARIETFETHLSTGALDM